MTTAEDSVVGMEFVADLESVCLALSSGDVLLYNVSTYELDCVGSVEVGVVCMGWSPEQDVVVLVTREDKLVLMTRDFDSITEVPLHPEDFGEGVFVVFLCIRFTPTFGYDSIFKFLCSHLIKFLQHKNHLHVV